MATKQTYELISSRSWNSDFTPEEEFFSKLVNEKLEEGYTLHGDTFIHRGALCQALVKEEPMPK